MVTGSVDTAVDQQRVKHNPDLNMEDAENMQWIAKTDETARDVPFDFSPRVSLMIERFFEKYDEFPCSANAISRRVKKTAELADEIDADDIYPHCLRATAATYHAACGLDVIPLQSLTGWAQVSTAHNYVQASGENTYAHFTTFTPNETVPGRRLRREVLE